MSMMLTFRALKVAIPAVFLFLLAACSREQQDWRSAEAADTVESYGQFLNRHPESELATQARTRVAQLAEEREWKQASTADTADAYREFLAQHPNGKWAQEARIRIQNFALNGLPPAGPPMATAPDAALGASGAAAPPASGAAAIAAPDALAHAAGSAQMQAGQAARAALSAQAAPGDLAATPANPTSAPPPASPRPPVYSTPYVSAPPNTATNFPTTNGASPNASTGYGVQLGAFGSQNAASNEWQQLKSRFGAQLQGLTPRIVTANTSTGTLFRLQAQVADEAHARSLCDMLRQQSQACVPVLPH
jgi:cell division septation protein DedD